LITGKNFLKYRISGLFRMPPEDEGMGPKRFRNSAGVRPVIKEDPP
jgi:hypothetical protein